MFVRKPFFAWVLANLLGFAAIAVALVILPRLMAVPGLAAFSLLVATSLGVAQWAGLRRSGPVSFLWAFTIAIGLLMAIAVFRFMPELLWQFVDDESVGVLAALFALLGFVIGLPQWLILRRQYPHAFFWPIGGAAGVALGFALVLASGLINASAGVSYYIIVIAVYVCVTGLVLSWLQDQSGATPAMFLETA